MKMPIFINCPFIYFIPGENLILALSSGIIVGVRSRSSEELLIGGTQEEEHPMKGWTKKEEHSMKGCTCVFIFYSIYFISVLSERQSEIWAWQLFVLFYRNDFVLFTIYFILVELMLGSFPPPFCLIFGRGKCAVARSHYLSRQQRSTHFSVTWPLAFWHRLLSLILPLFDTPVPGGSFHLFNLYCMGRFLSSIKP